MPRVPRAKRPRAQVKPKDPVWEVVKRLHLPMIEARAFMSALYHMGYGMNELGHDEGDTVKTLAGAARKRLEVISEGVTDLVQMARE
jgi:hypothetical protein